MSSFLHGCIKLFRYYKDLGDRCFDQLSDKDIHWRFDPECNNIATIVKHVVGNMRSRWTNFLTEDGEKPWRERDQEFEDTYGNKSELIEQWESSWNILFEVLNNLSDSDLERIVYIRNQGHTVTEALNRQLAHYAYHIGQIVFHGKMIKGSKWKSLSIPKGKSTSYNTKKFSQEKGRRHFTEDL